MQSGQANLLQNATFLKVKERLKIRAPAPQLPAASEQGTCTSTKRKTPEVKEVDPAVSTKDAKPSGNGLVKSVAKKTTAKKPKIIKAALDALIEEAVSLVEDLDDASTLSNLMKEIDQKKQIQVEFIEVQQVLEAKDRQIPQEHDEAIQFITAIEANVHAEEVERKHLEAKEEERMRAKKVEEERIIEIGRRLELQKKEKIEAEKKKKEKVERKPKEKEEKEEVERRKKEEKAAKEKTEKQKAQEVLKEKKRMANVEKEKRRGEEEAKQQEIEAKASMKAVTTSSSIKVTQSGAVTSTTLSSIVSFAFSTYVLILIPQSIYLLEISFYRLDLRLRVLETSISFLKMFP